MRAAPSMQDRLKGYENISVMYGVEPRSIIGDGTKVTGIELYKVDDKNTFVLPTSGVFLAIGHEPNTNLFKGSITMDQSGYIKLDGRSQKTKHEGIFAAGDVEDYEYRQAIVAAGSGSKAAIDASRFLEKIGFDDKAKKELTSQFFISYQTSKDENILAVSSLNELEEKLTQYAFVFVDFYTQECSICKLMLSHLEDMTKLYKDQIIFIKVDAEVAKEIAQKYFIFKVPSFLLFKDRSLVARYNTALSKSELQSLVESFLDMSNEN
jgi:thioredoxin reductase (NADPH)